jgi:hypothetical protein
MSFLKKINLEIGIKNAKLMLEEEEEEKPAHIKKDNIELQILRD